MLGSSKALGNFVDWIVIPLREGSFTNTISFAVELDSQVYFTCTYDENGVESEINGSFNIYHTNKSILSIIRLDAYYLSDQIVYLKFKKIHKFDNHLFYGSIPKTSFDFHRIKNQNINAIIEFV
jgi:hypothetical protein